MEQELDIQKAASRKHNDDRNDENPNNPCLSFEFLLDADQKDTNLFNSDQLKKDLLVKADGFFNSGCVKIGPVGSNTNQHVILSSSAPSSEDADRLLEDSNNLTKCFVAMDLDGEIQVPLEHIDGLKDELNASQPFRLNEEKPAYTKHDSQDMDSAEYIEKVLNLPPFDPHEPQVRFIIKRALSLNTISRSKDNVIQMFMPMKCIKEYMKSETFNPMMELLNTFAKHESDEFCTFCSCKECIAYREIAIHIMMEQFKASHMIVLLLDALIKAYSPLLKNTTAFIGFEKLLEDNKDIYWIASGLIYNKKYEHLDLIYDETLTDPMILVLFSSILMVNNPMQLLQILSFHIKCIIKAFALGICEIPAEEKLAYIIDGFDHLCIISEQIASYLFIFEKYFLNKFSLSWVCLCQRLFHQHVYMKFFVAITSSGESLKNDDPLKNRYFDFAKRIICTDMRWNRAIWPKLQRYNLSEIEIKRRKCMLNVHRLFDAVVEDALRLPLEESSDDNLFYDIHSLENRRLAWQNIMAFAKMKWPDGFFNAPNTLVLDFRCEKCGAINEQHESKCKCVTCSIGGDPFLPPSKMKNICLDCLLKQRKINDESQQNHAGSSSSAINEADDEDLKDLLCGFVGSKRSKERTKHLTSNISKMGFLERFFEGDISDLGPEDPYHISWATFKHLSQRERYIHAIIDEKHFCNNCNIPACMLARKLLNNEISPELTAHLVTHFHPLPLTKNETRALIPNIVFYNQRLFSSKNDSSFHNVVVKAYWTFIVSLYITYFLDFETPTPLNLSAFEIDQSDIKLIPEKLIGNKEDTKFLEFLAAIRSFAPPEGVRDPALILEYLQRDDVKQQLDNFLKSQEDRRIKILSMSKVTQATHSAEAANAIQSSINIEAAIPSTTAVTVQPTACNAMPETSALTLTENQQKKNCSSKPKKCCLEHAADLGADHCKDNHPGGKKRLKKDCSHARINETRDRLRKKLQNARKHQQQQHQQQQHQQQQPPTENQQMQSQRLQQPEIKQNPPNQIQHTSSASSSTSSQKPNSKSVENITPPFVTSGLIFDAQTGCNTDTEKNDSDGNETLLPTTPPPFDGISSKSASITEKTEKTEKVIGKVIEICDMIDNNKLKMKKWIDETLTYIEGYGTTSSPNATNANKKIQPQTKNPKKAAKKAKQKMRKEEEKRIGELHEFRAQFQDIYFKEFFEKIELKSLKSNSTNSGNKRRCDKKKVAEIEANIKKLQRAKAKIEGNILELIATVKQTNTEFKFSYLPTKEQQQAKLLEIENAKLPAKSEDSISINSVKKSSSISSLSPSQPNIATISNENTAVGNAFNYTPTPSKFFPDISFPYEMSFPMQNSARLGYNNGPSLPPKVGNPLCYAPTQQQLSPNVMVALAANENKEDKTAIETDPSKRIVTIRRVHNPNLPDSQVTVTARGNSANEDKLLYTFINGQMVPNPYCFKQAKSEPEVVPPPSNKSKLKKERRRQARLELPQDTVSSDCECAEVKEYEQTVNTHTKQKKSKAKEKNTDNTRESIIVLSSQSQSTQCSKNRKVSTNRNLARENAAIERTEPSGKATDTSKKSKKGEKPCSENRLMIESKKSLPQLNKPQPDKQNYSGANRKEEKKTSKVVELEVSKMSVPSFEIVSKEHRRPKLLNHGQFDNNPYKTLHMQDSDSELEMTASSCDEDSVSDGIDANDVVKFEEVSKAKLKQKPQKTTANSQQNIKNDNNATIQNKITQHQKSSNSSLPAENKSYSKSALVKEHQKAKSTTKKATDNQSFNLKNVSEHASPIARRSKQRENNNRTDSNKDHISTKDNDRKKTSNENVSNTKNLTGKSTYQPTTQRNGKITTKSSTPSTLSTRNTMSYTSLNSNVAAKPSLLDGKTSSLSKRTQRTRKKQDQQQTRQAAHSYFTDCGAGIPARMEHFNPNEVNIVEQGSASYMPQQSHLDGLNRQFQGLQIARDTSHPPTNLMPSYASVSANKLSVSGPSLSTASIMDQLNRGVQVENLSLPPGITLTKVDPIKSEQLRQKSESIKRLSQPLQPNSNNVPITPGGFQHHGSTILAPPVASYLPAQYISSTAAISGAVPLDQGNIIMVENISAKTCTDQSSKAKESASNVKISSKSKRRRNKGKRTDENVLDSSQINANIASGIEQQPKMITLRNPMFHAGPAAAAATILQQPGLLANRHGFSGENGGVSFPTPLPMDQPAAIIKNENGMFTIRNPALHQAVTNGLALSGYRQFGGNVSYYTPQEAVAEAARAAQHQVLMQKARLQATTGPTESFSYFSNNPTTTNVPTNMAGPITVSAATSPTKPSNKISITCSNANDKNNVNTSESRKGRSENVKFDLGNLTNSTPIPRPSSAQRCISAIGSEIKNNRNSAHVELLWSEYSQHENLSRSHENLTTTSSSMVGSNVLNDNNKLTNTTAILQDKYHQSSYYNGFEVFPSQSNNNNSNQISTAHSTPAPTPALGHSSQTSGATAAALARSTNSLFDATINDTHIHQHHHHMHHTCGDDSPPPTSLLGYSSSYLDDIPNTGVIRYDDASFLKNLIPGQRLNKEVSIHDINESSHGRTTSPMSHLVEITPVYSGNNKVAQSQNLQSKLQHFPPTSVTYSNAYQKNFNEFEPNVFPNSSNNYLNIHKADTNDVNNMAGNIECEQYIFNYDFETPTSSTVSRQKSITDMSNMFVGNSYAAPNHRTSPFLDDSTMEKFVQNLNALEISNKSATRPATDQCSQQQQQHQQQQQQVNGDSGRNSAILGNTSNSNSTNSTPASGWW